MKGAVAPRKEQKEQENEKDFGHINVMSAFSVLASFNCAKTIARLVSTKALTSSSNLYPFAYHLAFLTAAATAIVRGPHLEGAATCPPGFATRRP
jgi:hypothetical protein